MSVIYIVIISLQISTGVMSTNASVKLYGINSNVFNDFKNVSKKEFLK